MKVRTTIVTRDGYEYEVEGTIKEGVTIESMVNLILKSNEEEFILLGKSAVRIRSIDHFSIEEVGDDDE